MTADSRAVTQLNSLPADYPEWARDLAETYISGAANLFILHGNVHDFQPIGEEGRLDGEWPLLPDFLATQLFGKWDIVLGYDQTSAPHPITGANPARLSRMREILGGYINYAQPLPIEPYPVLALLDQLLERLLLLPDKADATRSIAIILSAAELLAPAQDVAQMAARAAMQTEMLLKWARNPYLRRVNVAFCLICERQSDLSGRLVQSSHTYSIHIPYPNEEGRERFIHLNAPERDAKLLSRMTAGLTLANLRALLTRAPSADSDTLKRYKKAMIERQCGGLVEFIEPRTSLDLVVGHQAAKRQLKQDADLILKGHFDAAPMGYLLCGPVGTGKSFIAECYAATMGLPCLKMLNFRSKYVGETEGNLERILSVLRVMGPVVIMIDEADAALGNREQEGDSGTSNRVFSQIAAQMGDTRYRGRIIWFLMTSRPDRLPIDIKRQGRAEVHIPLFYPQDLDEMKAMFASMAKKNKIPLAPDAIDVFTEKLELSGADIESIVTSGWRQVLIAGGKELTAAALAQGTRNFLPSAQAGEKEYQSLVAALECTDINFLPVSLHETMSDPAKRRAMQERLAILKAQLGMR